MEITAILAATHSQQYLHYYYYLCEKAIPLHCKFMIFHLAQSKALLFLPLTCFLLSISWFKHLFQKETNKSIKFTPYSFANWTILPSPSEPNSPSSRMITPRECFPQTKLSIFLHFLAIIWKKLITGNTPTHHMLAMHLNSDSFLIWNARLPSEAI